MSLPKPYYQDSAVTLYHGDCREIVPLLGRFDLLLTDPPYGIAWSKPYLKNGNSRAHNGIACDENTEARDAVLSMGASDRAIVFGSFQAGFPADVKQVLIWQKPGDSGLFGAVAGYRRDVEPIFICGSWEADGVKRSSVLRSQAEFRGHAAQENGSHPHAKPVGLIIQLLQAADASTVLDPFAGSGTTGRACKDLGRKCTMIEREERYAEIAARRMQQEVIPLVYDEKQNTRLQSGILEGMET